MGIEIERKYLVNKDKWETAKTASAGVSYIQGYMLTEPGKTIRVRIAGDKGYITIKGQTVGATRSEYEYSIPLQDARALLENFCADMISKIRYKIPFEGKVWEVDEFLADNEGLIVAEIELASETESYKIPDWIGKDVTTEARYYNSNLSIHPYKHW